jgi:hypothetical protein
VGKYFNRNVFEIEYNVDIQDVPASILYIPCVSNVIQVAWAVGADIEVETLDSAFVDALMRIQSNVKSLSQTFPCSTNIHVDSLETNEINGEKSGLLFSGGLDSTVASIKHRDELSTLIFFRGTDIPLKCQDMSDYALNANARFARSQSLNFATATMDTWSFLDHGLLEARFGRYLDHTGWWGGMLHGMGMSGACAPLSVVLTLGCVLMSSTFTEYEYQNIEGSNSLIINYIRWADVEVAQVDSESDRQEKIRELLKLHIENTGYYPTLRSCCYQWEVLNCCHCEKCLRTITGLILEGINPKKVGFPVEDNILAFVKQELQAQKFPRKPIEALFWKDIQKHIPSSLEHDLYGAREFFKWFREFDIKAPVCKESLRRMRRRFAYSIPSSIRPLAYSAYKRLAKKS